MLILEARIRVMAITRLCNSCAFEEKERAINEKYSWDFIC